MGSPAHQADGESVMRLDDEVVEMYRESRRYFLGGHPSAADLIHRNIRRDHGCELYYEVELPEHLMLVHPIGCVLGRATYGDYLCAYQGSGVGSDLDGNRPELGDGVALFPGARVLGNTKIGSNVFITANTIVEGCEVPDNSIVSMGLWGGGRISATWKRTKRSVILDVFKVPLA